MRVATRTPNLAFVACSAVLAVALFVVIDRLGMRQFPGEDGGITMNVAWQLWLHREPYTDVVAAFPPLFLLGARAAFSIFGQTWHALVLVAALYAAATFAVQVVLLRRLTVARPAAILIALGVQAMTTLPASFWWYNQVTAVMACLFATAALLVHQQPEDRVGLAALCLTTGGLLLAKPNVALPLLLLVLIALLISRTSRRAALIAAGAGLVVGALAFLVLLGATPAAYGQALSDAGGRATSIESWLRFGLENNSVEAAWTFALLIPVGAALGIAWAAGLIRRREALVLGAAVITSFTGVVTNNDYNSVDLALVVAVGLTIVASAHAAPEVAQVARRARAMVAVALVVIIAGGAVSAEDRDRIAAPGDFYQDTRLTTLPAEPRLRAFDGLHAGPRLVEVTRDVAQVVERIHEARGDVEPSIYFGPRLQWAYPALRERPAAGIPVYWEPFQAPSARSDRMVERFAKANIEYAVFLREDYTFIPKAMIDLLASDYIRADVTPTLTVYHRPGARI